MFNDDLQCIRHLKALCEEITDTFKRYGANCDILLSDKDYYKSVLFTIIQIGIESTELSGEFKDSTRNQMPWGVISGLKDIYRYENKTLDKSSVWEIATIDMPKLLKFCDMIIKQENEKKPSLLKQVDDNKKTVLENRSNNGDKKIEQEI